MTDLRCSLNLLFPLHTKTNISNVFVNGSIPTLLGHQAAILAERATLRSSYMVNECIE
jgi:hypothetical protein